jgi:hypothetical protein
MGAEGAWRNRGVRCEGQGGSGTAGRVLSDIRAACRPYLSVMSVCHRMQTAMTAL